MASTISINPFVTTNSNSSFLLQTDGYTQGTWSSDSPVWRYYLETGFVASSQSTPLWGGLPVSLTVEAPGAGGSSSGLGQAVVAATAETNIDGFCLFNQASGGVITGSSNVPLYASGMSVNFARIGCGMFVVLPVNPSAVSTIAGGASNQTLYWNFTNNYVDTTGSGALNVQIIELNTNSKTVTYSSPNATWNAAGSVIVVRI